MVINNYKLDSYVGCLMPHKDTHVRTIASLILFQIPEYSCKNFSIIFFRAVDGFICAKHFVRGLYYIVSTPVKFFDTEVQVEFMK